MTQTNTETSGGSRYSEGKPGMWWAVPLKGLRLVARVTEYGSRKYAPLDYREGQSFSTLLDCAQRHWLAVLHEGPWARDPESGCYHMAHAAWNILCLLMFMEEERHDLDDTEQWRGVTAGQEPNDEPGFASVDPTSPYFHGGCL